MTGPKLNERSFVAGERSGTKATAKYLRTSAYKAREVLDLIRGLDVRRADQVLQLHRPTGFFQGFTHGRAGQAFAIVQVPCGLVVGEAAVHFLFDHQVACAVRDDAGDGDMRAPAFAGRGKWAGHGGEGAGKDVIVPSPSSRCRRGSESGAAYNRHRNIFQRQHGARTRPRA